MKLSLPTGLLAAALTVLLTPTTGPAAEDDAEPPPRGAGVYYIDEDGDGYGVASPRGPDADDADESVNTPDSIRQKYADVGELLTKLGYNPKRIFYVAADAGERAGRPGDAEKPFAGWSAVAKHLRPGDMVLFREGVYTGKCALGCLELRGSSRSPIVIAAFPGERVVLDSAGKSLAVDRCRDLVFDGFVLTNSASTLGKGIGMKFSSNITLRNIESTRHYWGLIGMQDLHHILAERCVFHDNPHEHGVYLGARDKPNSEMTVRKCLIYRNGYHGFQHNGRVRNLILAENVIHTNNLAGVSLIMGVSNSVIRDNLIFNNNKQGIVFYAYDDRNPKIRPYEQSDNQITGNVIWIGRHSWNGKYKTADYAAVLFKDSTAAQKVEMKANIFRANTLVTQDGEAFRFSTPRFAPSTIIEDNLIHRAAGPEKVMTCSNKAYDFQNFESFGTNVSGNKFVDPQFADVSVDYCTAPEAFDFSRNSSKAEPSDSAEDEP
ncbi:MAG: right-handed parallel beta-helix repeat-containing protein [Planctomycetota bacterium]|jgi:hypothetical protein